MRSKFAALARLLAAVVALALVGTTGYLFKQVGMQRDALERVRADAREVRVTTNAIRSALGGAASDFDIADLERALDDLSSRLDDLEGSALTEDALFPLDNTLASLSRELRSVNQCLSQLEASVNAMQDGRRTYHVLCI